VLWRSQRNKGGGIVNNETKAVNTEEIKKLRLSVASSPHIAAPVRTHHIMLDVIISLIPAVGVAVYYYGIRALTVTLFSIACSVLFEYLYCYFMKKQDSIRDLSAVVTGLLLVLCLPVTSPYWMIAIGDFFAIVVTKQLFGGLGKNFMNPALVARSFLFSFPALMTTWSAVGKEFWLNAWGSTADAVTSATPMASMHNDKLPAETLTQMFFGQHGGSLGETCSIALLLGGLYLIMRGVIKPRIPVIYIATVAILTFLFPRGGNDAVLWMSYQLLGGGLLLGAFFMATDYVTSPVTRGGQIAYAIGCGGLTVFLRYFGAYPEGVCFSIIIMNTLVWMLDRVGRPHRFGTPSFEKLKRIKATLDGKKEGGK
jgi:electron transport complex protein RnfD